MVDRNRLFSIKELDIPNLGDEALEEYMLELFFFCDTLPSHEESIKTVLAERQYDAAVYLMKSLEMFLTNLRAFTLSKVCTATADELEKAIESGEEINHEYFESKINDLFVTLNTLLIDIVVAGCIIDCTPRGDKFRARANKQKVEAANILVVDDAKFFSNTLQIYFQQTKHTLTCVNSGEDAIEVLTQEGAKIPDMFLLDTELSGISGYELAKAITDVGINSPVVFLIGTPSKKVIMKALEVGGIDLIIKSSSKKQILERVEKNL